MAHVVRHQCQTFGLDVQRVGVVRKDQAVSMEIGPNEAFDIPPDHDGYTIGDEPCVQIEWGGLTAFTGKRNVNVSFHRGGASRCK